MSGDRAGCSFQLAALQCQPIAIGRPPPCSDACCLMSTGPGGSRAKDWFESTYAKIGFSKHLQSEVGHNVLGGLEPCPSCLGLPASER